MSELTAIIAQDPDRIASLLLAEPGYWGGLNALFQSPDVLVPMCDALGLTTAAEADALASGLRQALGDKLPAFAQWVNPRPGYQLAQMRAIPWAELQQYVATTLGAMGMRHAKFTCDASDAALYLPTHQQLVHIMAQCPAKRWPWMANDRDCDDHTDMLMGWLAQHDLGPLAVAFGGYVAYDPVGQTLGGHALGLAVTDDRQLWLCEPRDGRVYDINTKHLGGFLGAATIKFQRAIF